jgi:hypothetical protein
MRSECSEGRDINRALVAMSIARKFELNGFAAWQMRNGRSVAAAHTQNRLGKGLDKEDMNQA